MALKRLEAHHLIAIGYLALPRRGGKTMEQIAKECQVDRTTIYNWLKEPLFEKELKKEIARQSLSRLPEVIDSMADAAIKEGNAAAAKLVLQVNDMLTEKVEIEQKGNSDIPDLEELKRMVQDIKE